MKFVSVWVYDEDYPVGIRKGLSLSNIKSFDSEDLEITLNSGEVLEVDVSSIEKLEQAMEYYKNKRSDEE